MLADALIQQQQVVLLDISHNRVGSRGMSRLCKVLKTHESIRSLKADYNRIGPAIGKDIGLLLKQSKPLRILSLAHNRMGDLLRFPGPQVHTLPSHL